MDEPVVGIPPKFLNSLGFINYDQYGNLPWTDEDVSNIFLSREYKSMTDFLGIDCEMVGVGHLKSSALGRVSIVNEYGYCIYDTFVNPMVQVTDYRTKFSGVRAEDLITAPPLDVVLQEVADLVEGKILVGHSIHNDLDVLKLNSHSAIRDTALYFKRLTKIKGLPSLKKLTKKYLNTKIQSQEHSSIQDAQATMKLYLLFREEWENSYSQWQARANIVTENVSVTQIADMHVEPRQTDLFVDSSTVFVRANKILGPYLSCEEYLDTQFRLLLEDFLRPLRQAVQDINKGIKNTVTARLKNEVLHSVRIKKGNKGSFDVKGNGTLLIPIKQNNLKHWDEAGMFINGSLLLLSNNNFKTIKFAVVTWIDSEKDRNYLHVKVVFCKEGPSWITSSADTFSIMESKAFYSAYKHTLEYLQVVDLENFPMKKYIVDTVTHPVVPPHLLTAVEATIDFSVLMNDGSSHYANPLDFCNWPDVTQLNLSLSQYTALQKALTQELTIIQGPPGTGKTYTSLQIVKMLLTNEWLCQDSPLLIVSYTNHSLDQILELILEFITTAICNGNEMEAQQAILRIGGGSKSDKIQPLMLMYKEEKIQEKFTLGKKIAKYEKALNKVEDLNLDNWALEKGILNINKLPKCVLEKLHLDETCQMILLLWKSEEQNITQNTLKWFGLDRKGLMYNKDTEKLFLLRCFNLETILSPDLPRISNMIKTNSLISDELYITRWAFYFCLVNKLNTVLEVMNAQLTDYRQEFEEVKHYESKTQFLNSARIVGMTTTGAVKYKQMVEKLQPKIMIVEEAAHVLEAHVVASLTEHCQQMILIGDHKQLRPLTADHDLGEKYQLNISLMERLVQNGVAQNNQNWIQLQQQHRMRPEIATMICPVIYEQLENHPMVLDYPPVRGCDKSLFFVDHKQPDKKEKGSCSFYNEYEARYIVDTLTYFVKNGYYQPTQITIIVAYLAQKNLIDNMLKYKPKLSEVAVSTVDGYQGKENDIIFLSLVRSNAEKQVGFLKTDNRVCVALSRARHALFMVGNMTSLKSSSRTWKQINKILKNTKSIGSCLPLSSPCVQVQNKPPSSNQPESSASWRMSTITIWNSGINLETFPAFTPPPNTVQDFSAGLYCGDSNNLLSIQPNGYVGGGNTKEDCVLAEAMYLPCGHGITPQFQTVNNAYQCEEKKIARLVCGHEHEVMCGKNVYSIKCNIHLWKDLPCGHRQKSYCFQPVSTIKCNVCTERKNSETRYWDGIMANSMVKLWPNSN